MATAIRRKSQLFSKNLKPTRSFGERIEGADRLGLKRAFAEIWLKESPFQKYRYTVEICYDGQEIYLVRPTLSHGLDFEVRVKGFKSKSGSERPAHGDVTKDLQSSANLGGLYPPLACPSAVEGSNQLNPSIFPAPGCETSANGYRLPRKSFPWVPYANPRGIPLVAGH